jgi:hypothetical protein
MDPPDIDVGLNLEAIHRARRVALEGGSAHDVANAIRNELCLDTDGNVVDRYLRAAFLLTMLQGLDFYQEANSTVSRPALEIKDVCDNQPFWSMPELWDSETAAWAASRKALEEATGTAFDELLPSVTSSAISYPRGGGTHAHLRFGFNDGEYHWTLTYSRPPGGFWSFERIMAGNIRMNDPMCMTCQKRGQ